MKLRPTIPEEGHPAGTTPGLPDGTRRGRTSSKASSCPSRAIRARPDARRARGYHRCGRLGGGTSRRLNRSPTARYPSPGHRGSGTTRGSPLAADGPDALLQLVEIRLGGRRAKRLQGEGQVYGEPALDASSRLRRRVRPRGGPAAGISSTVSGSGGSSPVQSLALTAIPGRAVCNSRTPRRVTFVWLRLTDSRFWRTARCWDAGVADGCPLEVQVFQPRQPRQVSQASVGDMGVSQAKGFDRRKFRKVGQGCRQ